MAPAGLSFPCQVLRLPAREQQSSLDASCLLELLVELPQANGAPSP